MNTLSSKYDSISVRKAASEIGFSERTVRKRIKEGCFAATILSNKKGWAICRPSFEKWYENLRISKSNRSVKNLKNKQLYQLKTC